MKVGTDAMILGSIVQHEKPQRILDVGTGSGILALMMAQKFPDSEILGIDIHSNSIEEAKANICQSPYDKIQIQKIAFQTLALDSNQSFDLIISNPPFFQDDLKSINENRNSARHNDQLSFNDLIESAKKLLTQSGKFWFILPTRYHSEICSLIEQNQLYLNQLISLTNDNQEEPVRYIYSISNQELEIIEKSMNIRIKGQYSLEYIELTKDFHDRKL